MILKTLFRLVLPLVVLVIIAVELLQLALAMLNMPDDFAVSGGILLIVLTVAFALRIGQFITTRYVRAADQRVTSDVAHTHSGCSCNVVRDATRIDVNGVTVKDTYNTHTKESV